MAEPITFFHVGYARAASTFLQKTVFPALTGLQYIPRNNFRVRESEKRRFNKNKVLMSREAGEYIFDRCDKVWEVFESKMIVSVRRHDKLAESTYRLYAKNGYTFRFPEFLDVKDDKGVRKIKDWTYLNVLEHAEELTGSKPLLLIFEDYINDPDFYIDSLCAYLQCNIDRSKLSDKVVHKSYSDKQLRLRRQFSQRFLSPEESWRRLVNDDLENYTPWKNLKDKMLVRISGLFMRLARFIPDSFLDEEPLLDSNHSKAIKEFFAPDWNACFDYVEKQSELLGVQRNKEVSWK